MIRQSLRITVVLLGGLATALAVADNMLHLECFQQAGERYGVDIRLLLAVAKVESQLDMSKVNRNDNGSTDHGIMQINSSWKGELVTVGVPWRDVLELPCMNIHVGAWVLASNFAQTGVTWSSVGAYNAGYSNTEAARSRRMRYALKVYRAAKLLPSRVLQHAR